MICMVCGMRGCLSQGEWVENYQGQRAIRERWSCFNSHVWDTIATRDPATNRYKIASQIIIYSGDEENAPKSRVG